MHLTFFVGNGLDLKMGLHTSYRDFYTWEQAQTKTGTDNVLIQQIRSDYTQWSDFEEGFCNYCLKNLQGKHEPGEEGQEEKIFDDFDEIRTDLSRYLNIEQKRFSCPSQENRINMFKETLNFLFDGVLEKEEQAIRKCIDETTINQTTVNFIDFNYTNILDQLQKGVPTFSIAKKYNSQRRGYSDSGCSIKTPIHIHGTLTHFLTLGADNVRQLGSSSFSASNTKYVVKPESLRNERENTLTQAQEIIEQTDISIIFGMSIGSTDTTYWKAIGKNLLQNRNHLLLIEYFGEQLDLVSFRKWEKLRTLIENSFLSNLKLDEKQISQLRNQIFIVYNNDHMFKMTKSIK